MKAPKCASGNRALNFFGNFGDISESFLETVRVGTFLVFSRKFPRKCASGYVPPPTFVESILGKYFICMGVFLGQITTKNLSLRSWEITKKSFRRKLLKIFHFFTLWIWLFGIFDKRPQGCYEVKYSMGLLQGPRLMARTTKSPIRRNHWVPLGCRGHLGSVKQCITFISYRLYCK